MSVGTADTANGQEATGKKGWSVRESTSNGNGWYNSEAEDDEQDQEQDQDQDQAQSSQQQDGQRLSRASSTHSSANTASNTLNGNGKVSLDWREVGGWAFARRPSGRHISAAVKQSDRDRSFN